MIVNEREYKLSLTGMTLLIYKQQFHRDFLLTVSEPAKLVQDYELMFSVIWALCKTSNPGMADYEDFMASLTPKSIRDLIKLETIQEITNAVNGDMEQSVEDKKK